jgi:hypothetical protein
MRRRSVSAERGSTSWTEHGFNDAADKLNRWIMDLEISGRDKSVGLQRVGALLKAFNDMVSKLQVGGQMPEQTSNTPEKNKGKTVAELLATGEFEYPGGGLVKKKEKKDAGV